MTNSLIHGMLSQNKMGKPPAVKSLLFTVLLVSGLILFANQTSWAYFSKQAEEYRFKADQLHSEGRLDQAIVYYQKAIGLNRHSLPAYNGLAICFEKKGLSSRAEQWYLKALEINPQYAPAHYNLGLLYEKYGQIKKAIFHWRQRWRLGSPGEPARIKAQIKLERYDPIELEQEQAIELERVISEQKETSTWDQLLGRDKYRTKEQDLQEFYLDGMQSYQEGDYQGAAECFHKMIETVPISN